MRAAYITYVMLVHIFSCSKAQLLSENQLQDVLNQVEGVTDVIMIAREDDSLASR